MKPAKRNPLQQREKLLVYVFAGVILVWWIVVPLVQRIVITPLSQRNTDLAAARETLDDRQMDELALERSKRGLGGFRTRSLPPDEYDAQRLYQSWLTDLAHASGFSDLKVSPGARPRKDVYTAVRVTVSGTATLEQLSRFLHEFYRTDLLHTVLRMEVTATGTLPHSPLTVSLEAEGVAVHDAPPRDRLFPLARLKGRLAANGTQLTVEEVEGFPEEPGFRVRSGSEVMLVTAIDGTTWTVQRGADSTRAVAHDDGDGLELVPINPLAAERTPEDYRKLIAASPFALPVPPREYKPVLEVPEELIVVRGTPLKTTVKANDLNPTFGEAVYRLEEGAPEGMAIDARTGELTWSPGAAQKAGEYDVTIVATQEGPSAPTLSKEVEVRLREPNQPPVLASIAGQTLYIGQTLKFSVKATDPDAGNKITYKLGDGAPAGARIDSTTGEFQWQTDLSQVAGDVEVKIIATDSGEPALEDTETVKVAVKNDSARFTTLVGCVADDTNREAWLYNPLERKRTVLREGGTFEVADVSGTVMSIAPEEIVFQFGEGTWRLRLGKNLRDMERVAPTQVSERDAG